MFLLVCVFLYVFVFLLVHGNRFVLRVPVCTPMYPMSTPCAVVGHECWLLVVGVAHGVCHLLGN